MNEKEFDSQLQELSERVLSKALTPEEETNYTESLFESIRHVNEWRRILACQGTSGRTGI